ncbi:MAG: aminodeoxychorismate/anthranilate synthase component II [Rhodospirillaceae bacterium]
MFLLIDNYDSFTHNLRHALAARGVEVVVVRNNALSAAEALDLRPDGIVLSPGPCGPAQAGICMDLVRQAGDVPLLGVCLGHQAIAEALGGTVERAPRPMHGRTSAVHHDGGGLFKGLPSPFQAARYHSLIVARDGLPKALRVTAATDDGLIMGLVHTSRPLHGVQFHPESIACEHGAAMIGAFVDLALNTDKTFKGEAA